jgi:hypothetical protein
MCLAGFLGIPVIAWNADNTGLESVSFTGTSETVKAKSFLIANNIFLIFETV